MSSINAKSPMPLSVRPKKSLALNREPAEKRVGYYLRVSTEEQAENPEGSIKNQEERLKLALQFKNANEPYGKLVAVYCDIGRSGKDMNRPELQRLIKAIDEGKINLVMVSELSRLSRSIRDFSQIWEFMQARGCGFMSLRESFDTSNAAGEMLLYSIANFAQFERRQTSERVSANFLARAQRGLWNGGVLPLGYIPDPDQRGSLKIVDDEARVVRAAFQALLDQGSVSAAAKWLNREGYSNQAPLRGGGGKPRNRHFTFDSLHSLLSNPTYIGVRQICAKDGTTQRTQAVWPAMIDTQTFEKAQQILAAGRMQKVGRHSRFPYLLSTRIFCAQCQAPLIGLSAHGMTTKVPYYGHGTQIKREQMLDGPKERCAPFRIPGKKIEARVWEEVVAILETPHHRTALFQAIQALGETRGSGQALAMHEEALATIADKLAGLAQRITALPAGVPAEPFYDEMKRLAENQKRTQAEIAQTTRHSDEQTLTTEAQYSKLLAHLKSELTDLSPDSKRRVIQALVHRIIVTPTGFELHFYAGMEQIKTAGPGRPAVNSFGKNFSVSSSFKHLNGGSRESRTRTPLRIPAFEADVSTIPPESH